MAQKILIVEDDRVVSKAYGEHLEREGFEVFYAYNGQEGLDKLKELKPDLILLDVLMPVLDGLSVLRQLKAIPDLYDVPVLMLTNLSDAKTVNDALMVGATTY